MKARDKNPIPVSGRWIRPVTSTRIEGDPPVTGALDVDELATQLLFQTRRRVLGLAALERELEDRIRSLWEETEAEVRRKKARTEEEIQATRRRADGELKDAMLRGEKEGRAAGFREGFARGREEGYRLGYEEGRREGQREGRQEGKEEESRKLETELSGAAAALAEAAVEFHQKKEKLLTEAQKDLLDLSLTIAGKVLKKEVGRLDDVVVRNVEKAIDLIFRRGALVIQVNPRDAAVVEKALSSDPRWAQGFDSIEVRPTRDVTRGGCRLGSGAGSVDMTIETQLALIEAALAGAAGAPVSHSGPKGPAPAEEPAARLEDTDEEGGDS